MPYLPRCLSILSIFLLITATVTAHMELSWPIPFNSKFDSTYYGDSVDWSNTSPLLTDGSNFPCKHYHLENHNKVQATYTAGQSYNISLVGTATHLGGSCQISLSYDNGASFQVLKSMIGGCPLKSNWQFTVPSDAPTKSDALLAWSWFNLVGNREMYMNCARVAVQGFKENATLPVSRVRVQERQRQKQKQKLVSFSELGVGLDLSVNNGSSNATASFARLPSLFACDVGNGCTTIERKEVVFPDPGSVVEYGVDGVVPDPGPGFVISG